MTKAEQLKQKFEARIIGFEITVLRVRKASLMAAAYPLKDDDPDDEFTRYYIRISKDNTHAELPLPLSGFHTAALIKDMADLLVLKWARDHYCKKILTKLEGLQRKG